MWWNAESRVVAHATVSERPAAPVRSSPVPAPAPPPVDAAPPPAAPEAPPPAAAAPAPVDLGGALARSSPAATIANSLDALLQRWGNDPLGAEVLSLPQFAELLENTGFAVLALEGASLELVAAIDRPALLVLSALDDAPRGSLLTQIDGDIVTLEGVAPTPLRVSREELAAHWTGRVLVPWRDHATLPPLLGPGTSGPSVRWLQGGLAQLGFFDGEADGAFDAATQAAVRAFQTEEALPVDGWVGPLTLIRLYARLPGYAAPPRLASSSERPRASDGGTS
jgi:hypothetical protein